MCKKIRESLAAIYLCAIYACAQPQQGERIDTSIVARIKDEGMNRSQVMDMLNDITNVCGPRLTGSPEYLKAAEWAKAKLEKIGLQSAAIEPWGPFGKGWSLKKFSASMTEPQVLPLIAYPKAWSPGIKGTVESEVVYLDVKNAEELEKYKGKLKGAVVLLTGEQEVSAHFNAQAERLGAEELLRLAVNDVPSQRRRFGDRRGGDTTIFRRYRDRANLSRAKLEFCQNEGVALLLETSQGDGGTMIVQGASLPQPGEMNFEQRKEVYDIDAPKAIPQVVVAPEHYNRMLHAVKKGVPVKVELSLEAEFTGMQDGKNIVGDLPGTDLADQIVLIGGHFDSWHAGTGATDDATGVAVCMEAMRILKALDLKPRRTIRIGLWDGEEEGLLGSRGYASKHFAVRDTAAAGGLKKLPDYEKFCVYFNHDNGTGKIRGVYMQGNEAARPIFRSWLAPFAAMDALTLTMGNTGGTDHQSFDGIGLPAFQFIQDPIEYDSRTHHTNMDTYERVIEDDVKQAAVIMAAFAYNAAMRDSVFPRKPFVPMPGRRPF